MSRSATLGLKSCSVNGNVCDELFFTLSISLTGIFQTPRLFFNAPSASVWEDEGAGYDGIEGYSNQLERIISALDAMSMGSSLTMKATSLFA
jgi:hypothetical protein